MKTNSTTHRALFWLLLLILVAAGCRQEPALPTETPVAVVTDAPGVTAVAPTQTALPPTPDPTEPPTKTAEPTAEPTATEQSPSAALFEPAPCAFEPPAGREVECGYLVVPENRDDPADEDTLRLHVALFPSESANPAPDPIIYLEGGPGGDALETVPFAFEDRFAPFLAERDFIMFDQRGTGYAEPSLACPELTELGRELLDDILERGEALELSLEAMAECRSRLEEEGVDFTAYHSIASAADVDDLRQALGYEQVNLYGISYGTRLAQTIMRDFPDGVRSVILDSTYPLAANIVLETPANLARAMEVFFAGCAADPACSAAYPNLEETFWDTVAALDEQPVRVPVTHFLTGQRYEAALAGNDLIGVLFQGLYSAELIPVLPRLIGQTAEGNSQLLGSLVSLFLTNDEFSSDAMHFAVQCHEEISFASPEEAQAAVADTPRLQQFFLESSSTGSSAFETCALWQAGEAPAVENQMVESDIPTLVVAGEYDPITPPSWGEAVLPGLPNSYFFEFPGLGHGASLDGECPLSVSLAFLEDPTTRPEAECITGLAGPAFEVPGGGPPITMVAFTTDILGTQIAGLVPEGWEELSPGAFARQQSSLDETVLVIQVGPGMDPDTFVERLVSRLRLAETPALTSLYESEHYTWSLYETEQEGTQIDIALTEAGRLTLLLMFVSSGDERGELYDAAFLPALEAVQIVE